MAVIDLSVIAEGMSGRAGSADFANTKNGTIVRPHPKRNNPNTPAQQAACEKMTYVTRLYSTLTPEQIDEWRTYAADNPRPSKRTGTIRPLSGINAFTALTTKFLQIHPGADVPLVPPAVPFPGDAVIVTAEGGEGAIVFTANGANAEGVQTELLLQPLRSSSRLPVQKSYVNKAFVTFAEGLLTASVSVRTGWYAPAVRFVNPYTGEETEIVPLPPVHVA